MRMLLLTLLVPTVALANELNVNCTLKADKDDAVATGKDLEVKAGQTVKDAVVADGNVVIRKGASVKSVVALRGNVTIEDGATVRDSVVVVGGTAKVAPGARVKGTQVILGEGLHVTTGDGDQFDLTLSKNGESLGKKLVAEVLKDVRACRVEQRE